MDFGKMQAVFECAPQSDLIGLKVRGAARIGGGERGEIKGFSRASRSRMLRMIATLKKDDLPLFVTLTYGDDFPEDVEAYKYDLHKFLIYLFRAFPSAGAIWKLEYQKRGAAHFHLLLWGVSELDALEWIAESWYKIAGNGDENHLLFHLGELGNSPCVQALRSWRGVVSYASKYLSKEIETDFKTGRIWGVRGCVPFSAIMELRIDIRTALAFKRAYRRYTGRQFNSRLGFWAFGYTWDWLRFIDYYEEELCKQSESPPNYPPGWWRSVSPVDLHPEEWQQDFF